MDPIKILSKNCLFFTRHQMFGNQKAAARTPTVKFRHGYNKTKNQPTQQGQCPMHPGMFKRGASARAIEDEAPSHMKGRTLPSDLEVLAINSGGAITKQEIDDEIKRAKDKALALAKLQPKRGTRK